MQYRLIEFTNGFPGEKPRWRVAPIDGSLPHGVPSNGWATENMARRWVSKNGDSIVEVKRIAKKVSKDSTDSVESIREKYLGDGNTPYEKFLDIESKIDPVARHLKSIANEFKANGFSKAGEILKNAAESIYDGEIARSISRERKALSRDRA